MYDVLIHTINMDFYTIEFIYRYLNQNIFNNAIDIHYMIKNKIYKDINIFSSYYDRYIEWFYTKFKKGSFTPSEDFDQLSSDFKTFYDKLISEIDK